MLLKIDISTKTIGNKTLFKDLNFIIEEGEKVAIIGRNGVGKTTLFNILSGQDNDFSGDIHVRRGTRIVSTAQEHYAVSQQAVIDYILQNLPEYQDLKHIIDTYPKTMGSNIKKIANYSDALERFSSLNYYNIENGILHSLNKYQITKEMAHKPMANLSGGQKRFVELVRVEHADCDVALIDEPTNHMDYVAKAAFVDWLKKASQTVLVITHDRDVLQHVDKIIELKDLGSQTFRGNYQTYLKQNTLTISTQMNDYQIGLRTLENLKKQIAWAISRKPSWHGTADQKNPFVVMEIRLRKKYKQVEDDLKKPNFWIDRESVENLNQKVSQNYAKFKAKNIRIHKSIAQKHLSELMEVQNLQLGYDETALFNPISFNLHYGQRLQLVGRNGAGKTTLVKAIITASQTNSIPTLLKGQINCTPKLRLSVYEQEVEAAMMSKTLTESIEQIYRYLDLEVSDQIVMKVMSDYLFDPREDGRLTVDQLSGGQKARLQIIKMLAGNPNLLILDEPTNHLDLPSIEELENTLQNYHGAVLYVSHDSYFAKNIGGDRLTLRGDSEPSLISDASQI